MAVRAGFGTDSKRLFLDVDLVTGRSVHEISAILAGGQAIYAASSGSLTTHLVNQGGFPIAG